MKKRNAILFHFILATFLISIPAVRASAQGGRGGQEGQGGGGQRGQGGRGGGGRGQAPAVKAGPIRRMPDGKPDLSGYYSANAGGANYGLERHDRDFLTPATQGVVVD